MRGLPKAWMVMTLAAAIAVAAGDGAARAQSARDACADAARALIGQRPGWDEGKRSGESLRWRASDGSYGYCRVDSRGRVDQVTVERWGRDDVWVDGGGELTTEYDRDRRGDDYASFGVRALGDCQDACRNDSRCRAYTWSSYDRKCWLKSSVNEAERASGMVTGYKTRGSGGGWDGGGWDGRDRLTTERGVNRAGSDYRSFYARGLEDCQDACSRESRCQAYAYNLRDRTCYLKDRVPSGRSNADVVSGYKP